MMDENSYAYSGHMNIGAQTAAAQADSTIDWCDVTVDIRGRQVVPTDIDRLMLVEIDGTHDEVARLIESNELTMADVVAPWQFINDMAVCTANLSDFSMIANAFNVGDFGGASATGSTWLLSLTYYDAGAFDYAMPSFVVPEQGAPVSEIRFHDDLSTIEVDVDLHTLKPMTTSSRFDEYTLDWSAVTTDVYGNEYDDQLGNQVLIGKVPFGDIEQVEDVFLRLDDEASELYRLNVVDGIPVVQGETDVDLMLATNADGEPFGGFTTDGIWLVGVECTSCTSPAPLLLGVVQVVD